MLLVMMFAVSTMAPTPGFETPDQVADWVAQRKWVPLAGFVIFWIVRLLKSDHKFFVTIQPRHRVLAAGVLGIVSGVLEHVADGKPWLSAIIGGLMSSGTAVILHALIIDSARGGKEFAIPGVIPGVAPSPTAPVTIPVEEETVKTIPVPKDPPFGE